MASRGKAQVSMEYMVVIGFSLMLLIPILIAFYMQTNDLADSVNMNIARDATQEIIEHAELVYYLGSPSMIELQIRVPEKINNISLIGRQVTFEVDTQAGLTDVFSIGTVNLTGDILPHSGKRTLRLQATGNTVNITEV
ncbi:MAG: hypothetical protein ABIC95_07385 [archaeon]